MGRDIHAHCEIKVAGLWYHYSVLPVERDYDLFVRMAGDGSEEIITPDGTTSRWGSRGDPRIKPLAKPRGLPKDLAFVTWYAYKRCEEDAHTMSWLSAKEVARLEKWMERHGYSTRPQKGMYKSKFTFKDMFGFVMGYSWSTFAEGTDRLKYDKLDNIQDARVVFWFDN